MSVSQNKNLNVIDLPHKFDARPYQDEVIDARFIDGYNRFILIWHRRAGKDKVLFNMLIMSAVQTVGLYLYMLPKTRQAKKVIWKGRGKDGIAFLEHIPPALVKRINNTEMYIELINGSIIQLVGSDNYDSLVGTNPLGIVFSEWSICDPLAWDYLRPILVENGGWVMFCYTPRGRNHGYLLYDKVKNNKSWYVSRLTVNDTKDNDNQPIVTEEQIQKEREDGYTDDIIQQEFYCSFDAAIPGAYFSAEVQTCWNEGRILDIPIEPKISVFTFWDLGISDDMSIWLMQVVRQELRLIACYSASGYGMPHYINWLFSFAKEHNIQYNTHYAPHDIEVRELMTGESRKDTAKKMGLTFKVVPRVKNKADSINALRILFPKLWFDKDRCETGIAAITDYHREYDNKRKVFKERPEHDWASHLSDALQLLATSWKEKPLQAKPKQKVQQHQKDGWMQ